ncbi:MAG: flavodoxin domain-containing protein [Thermodesulfobacteriota bacterium]
MKRRSFLKMGLAGTLTSLGDKAWALKYYPRPSGKKWAILYGTWCGSSRDAGVWISEGLEGIADVFDVHENPDLKGFDHLVVGSSIRNLRIHPQLKKYLEENKSGLKDKVRGLWAVCHNMGQPIGPRQVERYIDNQLLKVLGVNQVPKRVFPGRITKSLLEYDVLPMMEHLPDSDHLKRIDCLEFGKEILLSIR